MVWSETTGKLSTHTAYYDIFLGIFSIRWSCVKPFWIFFFYRSWNEFFDKKLKHKPNTRLTAPSDILSRKFDISILPTKTFHENRPHGNTVSMARLPARRLVLTPPNVERAATAGTRAFSIPGKACGAVPSENYGVGLRSDRLSRHGTFVYVLLYVRRNLFVNDLRILISSKLFL